MPVVNDLIKELVGSSNEVRMYMRANKEELEKRTDYQIFAKDWNVKDNIFAKLDFTFFQKASAVSTTMFDTGAFSQGANDLKSMKTKILYQILKTDKNIGVYLSDPAKNESAGLVPFHLCSNFYKEGTAEKNKVWTVGDVIVAKTHWIIEKHSCQGQYIFVGDKFEVKKFEIHNLSKRASVILTKIGGFLWEEEKVSKLLKVDYDVTDYYMNNFVIESEYAEWEKQQDNAENAVDGDPQAVLSNAKPTEDVDEVKKNAGGCFGLC